MQNEKKIAVMLQAEDQTEHDGGSRRRIYLQLLLTEAIRREMETCRYRIVVFQTSILCVCACVCVCVSVCVCEPALVWFQGGLPAPAVQLPLTQPSCTAAVIYSNQLGESVLHVLIYTISRLGRVGFKYVNVCIWFLVKSSKSPV